MTRREGERAARAARQADTGTAPADAAAAAPAGDSAAALDLAG